MAHWWKYPVTSLWGRMVLGAILATSLGGCLMNTPPSRTDLGAQSLLLPEISMFDIRDIQVIVPRKLRVSEANTFRPNAEIVWHGDPVGDRYLQVERIVRDAMQAATVQYRTGRPVVMQIEVIRFHALTPKSRLTFGGKHDLEYALTLRDASDGAVIRHLPFVSATVDGAGGERARREEAAGRTEKVVIQEALMASIARELTDAAAQALVAARLQGQTTPGGAAATAVAWAQVGAQGGAQGGALDGWDNAPAGAAQGLAANPGALSPLPASPIPVTPLPASPALASLPQAQAAVSRGPVLPAGEALGLAPLW